MDDDRAFSSRPWGGFRNLYSEPGIHVKTLHVRAGKRLSLQRHQLRREVWMLISGDAQMIVGETLESLTEEELEIGRLASIPLGFIHRLTSRGGATVLETSFGQFDENDIERFEDDFGRVAAAG